MGALVAAGIGTAASAATSQPNPRPTTTFQPPHQQRARCDAGFTGYAGVQTDLLGDSIVTGGGSQFGFSTVSVSRRPDCQQEQVWQNPGIGTSDNAKLAMGPLTADGGLGGQAITEGRRGLITLTQNTQANDQQWVAGDPVTLGTKTGVTWTNEATHDILAIVRGRVVAVTAPTSPAANELFNFGPTTR